MSEQVEREIEIVAGTIGGITQKKADTWTVAINVEGFANPKNLWTKDVELVESLQSKFGQAGAFVCNASYWQHPQHGQVRSLWIEGPSDGTEVSTPKPAGSVATPDASVQTVSDKGPLRLPQHGTSEGMSKEEWARKDSAIHKMACIKTAADALKHTLPSDPSADDLTTYMERVSRLTLAWHRSVLAERDDPAGEEIPF